MQLIGCDFSSRPSRRKPVVLAMGQAQKGRVQLQALQHFESLDDFGHWLAQPADWVGGFDLPLACPENWLKRWVGPSNGPLAWTITAP